MTRILLVDDARLVLELERSFLKRSGCDLATATSGEEALEKARSLLPDLILLDADLPGMDGVQCCKSIKADPALAKTPVVFVLSPLDEGRCAEAGADGFVPKPVTRNRLLETVRRFVHLAERESDRAVVSLRVECSRGGREHTGYARDLAADGLFLKTREKLRVGERVDLAFSLPAAGTPAIRAVGEVVRVVEEDQGPHQPAGAGIRFREISARNRLEITRYLREHAGETP